MDKVGADTIGSLLLIIAFASAIVATVETKNIWAYVCSISLGILLIMIVYYTRPKYTVSSVDIITDEYGGD